jgi:hypothetical protein
LLGRSTNHELCHPLPNGLKATGNWFAGSERNLEELIASYDVTADLFSPTEAAAVEAAFALNANYLYAAPEGVPTDMASRSVADYADVSSILLAIGCWQPTLTGYGVISPLPHHRRLITLIWTLMPPTLK